MQMPTKTVVINGFTFILSKWNLPRVMQEQGKIMNLLSKPFSMLAAVGDEMDESIAFAALTEAFMKTLAEQDMSTFVPQMIKGINMLNENGVEVDANIQRMSDMGVEYDTVIVLLLEIVKYNFGSFLKNDFVGQILEVAKQ